MEYIFFYIVLNFQSIAKLLLGFQSIAKLLLGFQSIAKLLFGFQSIATGKLLLGFIVVIYIIISKCKSFILK